MSRNNTRSNSVKYGLCTNMEHKPDGTMCSLCQKKEKQAIRSTKDFVCAECGAPLKEVTPPSSFPTKIVVAIIAILLVIAAVIVGVISKKHHEPEVPPIPIDTPGEIVPEPIQPSDTIHDTVVITRNDTSFIVVHDTVIETIVKVQQEDGSSSQKPRQGNTNGKSAKSTKKYSIGKYVGCLRNGIPEGEGKMYYSCHVQIARHDTDNPPHYAEAGDWFDGTWGNGDIVSGALYSKDGKIKEKIFAPKRFSPYDLNSDKH